jgi:zinc transport system substrate-binding protein
VTASDGIELLHAEEDEHEDEHGKEHAHGDLDVDPHVWVSPKSALKIAENVKNGFIAVDKANQAYYEANYETLRKQLVDLDAKFSSSLASAKQKEIVVSHQAFGYLCRDYGLTQMPVLGLSPDSEPTAQDLKRINQFVKEHQVKYIFFEELVSDKTANMLAKDAGISTLVLNPLEGLTKEQAKAGESYVSIMEKNLQNLLKALQ